MIENDLILYFCERCEHPVESAAFFIGTIKVCRHCGHRTKVPRASVRIRKAKQADHANEQKVQPPVSARADRAFYEKVLEVSPEASLEEIKKAYRKQLLKYHPDRVQHLGQEFHEMADKKTKLINEAYEYFQKTEKV